MFLHCFKIYPILLLQVTLPEDLLDVYWVTVGIAGGVVAAILLVLLIIWRYRVRREYVKYAFFYSHWATVGIK